MLGLGIQTLGLTRLNNADGPTIVGGHEVGTTGTPIPGGGTYVLAWGEDFNSSSVIVGPSTMSAPIFPTRAYLPGARGSDTLLQSMYDTDMWHTGHEDSNRGVPVGFTNMTITNSEVKLQARNATASEITHMSPTNGAFNGGIRNEVSAIVHGSGAVAFYPATTTNGDVVVEFRTKFSASASNPTSFHPDDWVFSLGPAFDSNEWDFEGDGLNTYYDQNLWEDGSYTGTFYGGSTAHDGNYHTFAFVLRNGGDTEWWVDGVKVANVTADSNTHSKLMSWISSAHVLDGNWKLGTYSQAAWDADGDGATKTVDWIRVWNRSAAGRYRPSQRVWTLDVNYTGSGTITFPSKAALWGDGTVTEFLQVIPFEENEPAGHHTVGLAYGVMPTGVTNNVAASRQIAVDFSGDSSGKAGVLHMALYGYKTDGSVCEPARVIINRGPRVTSTTVPVTQNEAFSFDLYAVCDVGRLTPKTISVTGLPTGASFSSSTGLITGTVTTIGTTQFTVDVTNSVGQNLNVGVDMVVSAAGGGVFSTDFTGTALDDITVLGFTRVDGINGAIKIAASNQSRADTTTQTAYTAPTTGSTQHYAQGKILSVGSGGPGIACRLQDADNWVYVSWSTTGYTVNKRVAGTVTVLGTRSGTAVINDVIRLEVTSANNVRLLVNGVEAIAPVAIAAAGLTAQTCGLVARLVTKNPFIDDFECGPF